MTDETVESVVDDLCTNWLRASMNHSPSVTLYRGWKHVEFGVPFWYARSNEYPSLETAGERTMLEAVKELRRLVIQDEWKNARFKKFELDETNSKLDRIVEAARALDIPEPYDPNKRNQ